MRFLITVFCLIITCNAFASDYKPMDGYSSSPLEDPVFDFAKVIVDSKLDSRSMKGPREHLYYLLSSYVSEINKRDGLVIPKENDLVLETMLSWSERLGVYGAHLFYNKLKRPDSKTMPELMKIPEEFIIHSYFNIAVAGINSQKVHMSFFNEARKMKSAAQLSRRTLIHYSLENPFSQ